MLATTTFSPFDAIVAHADATLAVTKASRSPWTKRSGTSSADQRSPSRAPCAPPWPDRTADETQRAVAVSAGVRYVDIEELVGQVLWMCDERLTPELAVPLT